MVSHYITYELWLLWYGFFSSWYLKMICGTLKSTSSTTTWLLDIQNHISTLHLNFFIYYFSTPFCVTRLEKRTNNSNDAKLPIHDAVQLFHHWNVLKNYNCYLRHLSDRKMVQWWLCIFIFQTKKQRDNSFTIEEIPKGKRLC